MYKEGLHRNQQLMFPPSIDDYVDEDNVVRAIDSYVELLDFKKLQFSNTRKSNRDDGQKAYSPKLLLKIYIYGYLNKIRSSRMLEKECKRNIELMWLTQSLTPSYHTIADFRKDNPKALKQVFKEFVLLCKSVDLIGDGIKAVDGAFLRANASKNTLTVKSTLSKDLSKIEKNITEYLQSLEYSDKEKQPLNIALKLPKDLRKLKYHKEELSKNLQFLEKMGKTQHNTTDPDASLMVKPAHNLMAYNSQIVVDSTFKFIVATDTFTKGSDFQNLHTMAQQTKENLELEKSDNLDIVADIGYYSAKEFKKCTEDNINAIVPEANIKKVQQDKGMFTRDKFIYDTKKDCYTCPNNQTLNKRVAPQIKNGKTNYIYAGASAVCKACSLKNQCIPTKTPYKQIYRWEHEHIIEKHQDKMKTKEAKDLVKKRGSIVEHPFGTIKRSLGWDHFLVRGKEKVSGENSLIMFTYNFKRLLNLIGITLFQKLIKALISEDRIQIEQIKQDIAEYILCFYRYLTYLIMIFEKITLSKNKYQKILG
jgi:transposase